MGIVLLLYILIKLNVKVTLQQYENLYQLRTYIKFYKLLLRIVQFKPLCKPFEV